MLGFVSMSNDPQPSRFQKFKSLVLEALLLVVAQLRADLLSDSTVNA